MNILKYKALKSEEITKDNPAKAQEILKRYKLEYEKFLELFNSDEIIIKGNFAEELKQIIETYIETSLRPATDKMAKYLEKPETYYYTPIKNNYLNSDDNEDDEYTEDNDQSALEFEDIDEDNVELHDFGLIATPEYGIEIIPYYGTFKKICESPDFKTINGYEECVRMLIDDTSITDNAIFKAIQNNYRNFLQVLKDVYKTEAPNNEQELEQFIIYNKPYFKKYNKITGIYNMFNKEEFFESFLNTIKSKEESYDLLEDLDRYHDIGRNDPCPCESGKKYKKCCYNKVQELL